MTDLDHPCRDTCSGWKQGYDKGYKAGRKSMAEKLEVYALKESNLVDNWGEAIEELRVERARSAKLIEVLKNTCGCGRRHAGWCAQCQAVAEYEVSHD